MTATFQEIFLGRQPILDRNEHIVAYELLFRSTPGNDANIADDLLASAQVITQAFTNLGVIGVLGDKQGFINVSGDLLLSDMIKLLPCDKVVIELLETIQVNPPIIERCHELKAMGFTLALDDFDGNPRFEPLLGVVDIVKVDLMQLDAQALQKNVHYLQRWPVKLLAEKVEDVEQADFCKTLGFSLFQGYYYARPVILQGKRADPSKMALLRLVGLVLAEAPTKEIEQIFKQSPALSFNLLRLVNSVAMGSTRKISSISQALAMLGHRQLQRWLQLLLFASPDCGLDCPLLELAATRGKLMELLAKLSGRDDSKSMDHAFMAGIMSLLDALLGMPLQEIIREVNLADDVENALLNRTGWLGTLLTLVEKREHNEIDAVDEILTRIHLNPDDLAEAQLEAMHWANSIKEATP
jgi:EAL and modified HD-GYP domain-containing signal transduction protein